MPSEAAEHFWPAWPKAELTRSFTARSRSALGVTTIAFLPLVSAEQRQVGAEGAEQLRGLEGAGEDQPVDQRVGDQAGRPRSPSSTCDEASASLGTPASQSAWTISEPQRRPGSPA